MDIIGVGRVVGFKANIQLALARLVAMSLERISLILNIKMNGSSTTYDSRLRLYR